MNLAATNFVSLHVMMASGKCTLIVDTGADISIFKRNKITNVQILDTAKRFKITGITDGSAETLAETETMLQFENGLNLSHNFQIVDENFPIPTDGILGRDFFCKYKCSIDYDQWLLKFLFNNHSIEVPIQDSFDSGFILPNRCEMIKNVNKLNITEEMVVLSEEIQPGIFCGNTIISPEKPYVKFINTTDKPVHIKDFSPKMEPLRIYQIVKPNNNKTETTNNLRLNKIIDKINIANIPEYAKDELYKLIAKFQDVFCLPNEKLSTNNFYSQNITLKDQIPVYIPNYKNLHSLNDESNAQIKKMLDENVIEHSVSAYNSPVLLVPKKSDDNNKKWRLVVDYRQLNKKVLADKFPLPRIDTILDQLGRAKYFTTLDLARGFHQIPLDEDARKYTAFSSTSGHYQFTRLPFGLNISPNSFQRMMNIAMAGLSPECAFVYIDDIVVIGCSVNHHIANLSKIFERLRQYNLKLNPEKCNFFQTEVTYLGHKITDKGILPDDSKFKVVRDYPTPTNADEVRRFVAFCNYYRKFVPNFAKIAKPLNELLQKNFKFEWTPQRDDSFNKLKNYLLSPQILKYPDFIKFL